MTLTSNHLNSIRIRFHDQKHHIKVVLLMIICLFVFSRQLISKPGGGHIGFCQYGSSSGHSSWRSSKIEKIWLGQHVHVCQIWCFWKNLNQKSLTAPTKLESVKKMYHTSMLLRGSSDCNFTLYCQFVSLSIQHDIAI